MPYLSIAFDVITFDQAKNVVLTTDPNNPNKFIEETEFVIDAITKQNIINSNSTVLDFGCGMGRVSKRIVEQFNCNVIGTDISNSMLTFAKLYVANIRKFHTQSTPYDIPNSIDVCLCIFTLQHVEYPQLEIDRICNTIKPNGYLILLNEKNRFIPESIQNLNSTVKGIRWGDDGYDIIGQISSRLKKIHSVQYMNSKLEIGFYRKIETEGDKQSAAFLKDEYYDL